MPQRAAPLPVDTTGDGIVDSVWLDEVGAGYHTALKAAMPVDTTGDGKRDTHVAGRSSGMSGSAHDLTGDGHADFIDPPMAAVYWAQELLPAMLLLTRAPEF